MSTFLILGLVCCVFAASSSLLVGIFRSAPLVEDLDARPAHQGGHIASTSRRERRSSRKGVRIFSEKAHTQVSRRAV